MRKYAQHFGPRLLMLDSMKSSATVKDAMNLWQRFQKGETFRPYVMKRLQLVIPAIVFFLALSMACAAATVVSFSAIRAWLALPALLLAPLVLLGSFLLQLYVFFAWLEDRALARALHQKLTRKRMLAALRRVPWPLAAALLGVPLALLVTVAPAVAAILFLLSASTPALYALLDR
jgi:hypothetical protein